MKRSLSWISNQSSFSFSLFLWYVLL